MASAACAVPAVVEAFATDGPKGTSSGNRIARCVMQTVLDLLRRFRVFVPRRTDQRPASGWITRRQSGEARTRVRQLECEMAVFELTGVRARRSFKEISRSVRNG